MADRAWRCLVTILFGLACVLLVGGALGVPPFLSKPSGGFMSRNYTSFINGFFIVLVFLSHVRQYVPAEAVGPFDQGFYQVMAQLNQLIVATFLFFSGYGIMESLVRKRGYVSSLPARRILPFLVDVWIALVPFLVIRVIQGTPTSLGTVLLSMVGWQTLGNSNWYIFAILFMWIATWAAFRFCDKGPHYFLAILVTALLAVAYAALMKHEGVGKWYYDTILCFPAGMAFSECARAFSLDRLGERRFLLPWIGVLFLALLLFLLLHSMRFERAIVFNACAVSLCLVLSLLSARVRFVGTPLVLAGERLFYLYIYQRIPMILLQPMLRYGTFCYVLACLGGALLLAALMPRVHARVKQALFTAPEAPAPAG